jgi:hypothetical protein
MLPNLRLGLSKFPPSHEPFIIIIEPSMADSFTHKNLSADIESMLCIARYIQFPSLVTSIAPNYSETVPIPVTYIFLAHKSEICSIFDEI